MRLRRSSALPDGVPKWNIRSLRALEVLTASAESGQTTTTPPPADPVSLDQITDRVPPGGWRHHFFELMSFMIWMSSLGRPPVASAVGSRSPATTTRRASLMSSPPYYAFHRLKMPWLMPCLRSSSGCGKPDSASFSTPMICSSVNRLPLIRRPRVFVCRPEDSL